MNHLRHVVSKQTSFFRRFSHSSPFPSGAALAGVGLAFALVAADPGITTTHMFLDTNQAPAEVDDDDEEILIGGQVLERHLFSPRLPYPLWNFNWDDKMTENSTLKAHQDGRANEVRGVVRHVFLVRHGQYEEITGEGMTDGDKLDYKRKLTPLGRQQAELTGKRLAEFQACLMEDGHEKPSIVVRSSGMKRARETAEIIKKQLKGRHIKLERPDTRLNEALPSANIPPRKELLDEASIQEVDDHHGRIERAFRATCHRGVELDEDEDRHEFEIVVCHGNVIRYFFCRALQLPPEAWLRMSIFNASITYLVIRPNGLVTGRMLGDIGHLDYDESTFSSNHGFVW